MSKRRNITPAEQQERIARANEQRAEHARLKKEYDAVYRKSALFRATVVIRILIILFAVYINSMDTVFFHTKVAAIASVENESEDVIKGATSKYSLLDASWQEKIVAYAHVTTNGASKYSISLDPEGNEKSFIAGDTIIVQHTFVGKPSYIANNKNPIYFPVKQFVFFKWTFLFTGIVLLISLFMNSGYDLSARLFVRVVTVAGLGLFIAYLIW